MTLWAVSAMPNTPAMPQLCDGLLFQMSADEWWGCWESAVLTREAIRWLEHDEAPLHGDAAIIAALVDLLAEQSPDVIYGLAPDMLAWVVPMLELTAAVARRLAPHCTHPYPGHVRMVTLALGLPPVTPQYIPNVPAWLTNTFASADAMQRLELLGVLIADDFVGRHRQVGARWTPLRVGSSTESSAAPLIAVAPMSTLHIA